MNKSFENIKTDLMGAVNQKKLYQHFPNGYSDYCGRIIPNIIAIVEKADTNPQIDPKLISDILAVLQDTLNYLIMEVNTDIRVAIINDMLLLIYNFNQIAKSKEIETLISSIQKFTDLKNNTDALITASKRLIEKMDLIYKRNPSFYKLSEHYLRELNTSLR